MELKIVTEMTIRQFVAKVSNQQHAMSGAVIAVAAAQAAALGEACVQISLDNQVDKLDWHGVSQRIAQIAELKEELIKCYDYETNVITDHLDYMVTDKSVSPHIVFESGVHVGQLILKVIQLLEEFRPSVFSDLKNDFDITVKLLLGAAQSNGLLLNSYLQLWPDPTLVAEYEPQWAELAQQLSHYV